MQRKADAAAPAADAGGSPPSQGRGLQQLFGRPGAGDTKAPGDAEGPPPAHLRSSVERVTGTSLGDVRVHEGPGASSAARETGALAFASGSDVVLGAPDGGGGISRDRLLAHELVHTAQQRSTAEPHGSAEDAEREADAGADAALSGQPLSQPLRSAPRGVPQRAPAPYDTTQFTLPSLPSGYTLAMITGELKKKQSGTPPDIKSWTANGVKPGSTEELYVLYAIWQLARAPRWGTESDLVTEIARGKKGAIQVKISATGDAVGTLVAPAAPAAAATFATVADAITGLKTKFGLIDVIGEKGQSWTVDQLNKVSGAWGRLGDSEEAALSGYKLILTDNTLTGPGGTHVDGLTTRQDKTSADGLSASKTREIRFTAGMFDVDLTSFVGDSSNAAPASFLTIIHEAGHAQETKLVDDANTAEMAALVETNKAIVAGNAAGANAVASRNTAVLGHWNHFKPADQTASKPFVDALDAAHKAIAAFRIEPDPTKMAALESPAQAAVKTRDTAKAAVPAANPAHAKFATAVADQDAHLMAARNVLAKRQAKAAAATVTAAAKNPAATSSKRLQAFVDFVTTNGILPVTQYATDNWPAKPAEFYAEAFSLWHNDPVFFASYSAKLKTWFDNGNHLK